MKIHHLAINRIPVTPMDHDLQLIRRKRRIYDAAMIGVQAVTISFFICAVCAALIAWHG